MRDEPPEATYGPDYGPRIEWENGVLLQALQASRAESVPLFEDWRSRPATDGWSCMLA